MFKNIKIQAIFLLLIMTTYGCVSDEGNYDYNDINEVKVTGIDDEYTVYSGDSFKITPKITATLDADLDSDRYEYQWVAVNPLKTLSESKTIIGTSKNLEGILKIPPAVYNVYYFIKDKETGVNWQERLFKVNVVSAIYQGWMVIGDVDGKARLDMVSLIPGVTQPRIINDVLDYTGSALKLSGKAVNVFCFNNSLSVFGTYGIYATASESGTSRLDPDSFAWTQSQNIAYETVGGSFPTNFGVDFAKSPTGGENFFYSKGNIYYFYRVQNIKYGLPQNIVDTETKTFNAAPFIAQSTVGRAAIFYDKDLHRFVRFNFSKGYCSAMPPLTGSATVLDWNNTNSDLIYMATTSFNRYENHAVLKNITTGKFYLLRMSSDLAQVYYKEILNAPDFDKAQKFAISPDSGYLFYTVGNKVYEYDSGTQSAKLMLDKGTEEITYLGFNQTAGTLSNKLLVGTYNGSAGTLQLYTVPPVNGDLVLTATYNNLCKIKDVAYRVR